MKSASVQPMAGTSGHGRPVVMLEAPENEATAELWRLLEEAGCAVSWCPGPSGPPPVWCPLLAGARCRLVEAADAVVCALGWDDPACRHVLDALERLHPEAPVIVPDTDPTTWARSGPRPLVAPAPGSARQVVEAVGAAVRLRAAAHATGPRARRPA